LKTLQANKEAGTMVHRLPIQSITPVGGDVFQYAIDKPPGFNFRPGQATEVSIDKDDWRDERRPFTFTSLPDWEKLQFTIKSYPDHNGVTRLLPQLSAGDHLLIGDAWGTIQYRGRGTFIAGGAGMTPFLSILRDLQGRGGLAGHTLYFANKTQADIFVRSEIDQMEGLDVHHVLSRETVAGCFHGRIDEAFLRAQISDFSQRFYVCGPAEMVKSINEALTSLGADPDGLVFEK
jgi:ferredoxin-NADP reductase